MAPDEAGIIEGVYQKSDRNLGTYWIVQIGGQEYAAFDRQLIHNLTPGTLVSYR